MVTRAVRDDSDAVKRPSRRLPFAVFLAVSLCSLLLWSVFAGQQRQADAALLEQRLQGITVALSDQMEIRGAALERLALRQAAAMDEEERRRTFALDVPRYLRDFAIISTIYWVSPDRVILQRESLDGSALPDVGERVGGGAQLDPTLRRARAGNSVILSPAITLPEGRKAFVLVSAGAVDGELRGYLLAVHGPERRLPPSLELLTAGSPIAVRRGSEIIYTSGKPGKGPARTVEMESFGESLSVDIWPRHAEHWTDHLDIALLLVGILAGAFLAIAMWFSALARHRGRISASDALTLRETELAADDAIAARDAAERTMGAVFERISEAVLTVDREWRVTAINSRAEQLLRRKEGELIGRNLWSVFPEAVGTDVERRSRLSMSQRQPAGFEVHFEPLDGWFSVRAYPTDQGLAIYFQDISQRKSQEQAMLRAQVASDRAQRHARLGSSEHDLATGQVEMSSEAMRMLGLTPEKLKRGLPALLERVRFEDRAQLQEGYRSLHAGESDLDIEYSVMADDGETRVIRELGTLIRDASGAPTIASLALQDITERQRGEQAQHALTRRLEQSLSMKRLLMDNSQDVICVLDANGRFIEVSQASQRIWGHAPHSMVGRPLVDFTHPEDRDQGISRIAAIVAGQSIDDFRSRFVCSDGRLVTMQLSVAWARAERLMFAIARDVTQADAQSRALQEARDGLERAQKVARMGSWEFEVNSGRLHWSEQVFEIFQVTPEEFTGTYESFAARVHPDDMAMVSQAQAQALEGEGDHDIRHRIILRDGGIGYVHERARKVCDDNGAVWLLAGTVQDVTEQVLAEQAIERERSFLLAMLENMSDGIVACDAQGNLTIFNRATRELHGLPLQDVPPERWAEHYDLFQADGRTPMTMDDVPLLRALRGEVVRDMDLCVVPKGKTPRTVICSGQRITSATGELLGAVVALRDVTEARRARDLEDGRRDVLAGIAARRPLAESLESLTRLYEAQYPGSLCSVLLLDEAGKCLLASAAPSLPKAYVNAIHGQPIGPKAGSCGTAAYRREPVISIDIQTDPLWEDYAALAAEHDLRACWSMPVLASDGRVLATFANYFRDVRAPGKAEMAAVQGMASLAAVAIEHANAFRAMDLGKQRFRSLFDEHPDAVYSMDLDARFTAYNDHFQAITGRTKETLLGQRLLDAVAPEQRDVAKSHFAAAARGEARTFELTYLSPDGTRMETRVTHLPIMVEDQVTGVFGIAQDITLLRKHQRDLALALDAAEASSIQLRRLSESAVTLNRSIGAQDMYQQLVDSLRETLGAHQALVSLNVYQSHAQEISAMSLSAKYTRWATYDTPTDGTGIYSLVCETNRPLRLTQAELEAHPRWRGFGAHAEHHPAMRGWLAVPLIASSGKNLGLLQLSDKVQGEFTSDDELVAVQFAQMASIAIERADLIEKLSVRNRFFDLSLEVFVVYDPALNRWSQVNPVFCELLGYSEEELCSREISEFMHPDDRELTVERATHFAGGVAVPRMFENRYYCRDGSIRWMEWMSERGGDGLVYGVGRDISKRRHAELALRQTLADLDSRNRELQDFAFVASHDLQEPLRKIRAFSDRLQQHFSDELSPEARDYLARSSKAAARMQTLIDDLLAYSRIAARGKVFVQVDMGALLDTVLEDLEARIESSGGRIEAGLLPCIEGDPSQLRQVLQNLVANALKFRAPDRPPVVRISAEATRLEGEPAWRFNIQDNGIGFEPRHAEKVFVPFQRLHGRQDFEGTGIGLAIVRRIIERHRGVVTAEAQAGEGAVFTVCLPERQSAAAGEGATTRLPR